MLASVFLLGASSLSAQAAPDSAGATVAIYTASQARRGQSIYQRNCITCHTASAYSGAAFRRVWAGKSPFDLWEQIRTSMPQDNPGRLKPGEYADIVAYLLRLNGYPAGETELPADAEKLQQLRIAPTPGPGER
jgi:mono/diheme cytochrome c family protein